MLPVDQFTQLSYAEKKQILVDIFSQLNSQGVSFDDTIFLLNASNQIKESTLNKTYDDVTNLLQKSKDMSQEKYMSKLRAIQEKIEKNAEKESAEADALLDNIE
jgi:hypothetical protein